MDRTVPSMVRHPRVVSFSGLATFWAVKMLATVLIWFYTLFLCYVYGFLFLKLLQRFLRIEADFPIFPLTVVAGLVALTTLASFFSLFPQTGFFLNLLLFGGAL